MTRAERAARFQALPQRSGAFPSPNLWDAGSARILAGLGFEALSTSSGAAAASLGRGDGRPTCGEARARPIVEAKDLPVSAGLENGFDGRTDQVARTVRMAAQAGWVGGSIEDSADDRHRPLYDPGLAAGRIAAVV